MRNAGKGGHCTSMSYESINATLPVQQVVGGLQGEHKMKLLLIYELQPDSIGELSAGRKCLGNHPSLECNLAIVIWGM